MCLGKMIKSIEKKIKNLRWFDMSLIKLATAAFILMVAVLWSPILSLAWYWYLIIAIIASIRPFKVLFMK